MIEATMVYKPGNKRKIGENFFDYKIVDAVEIDGSSELEKALEEGWFRTPPEALEASTKEETTPSKKLDENGPTRDELKEMASQLGLTFASNIPTAQLEKMIEEKLES